MKQEVKTTKSLTKVDKYECKLSKELQKMAERELRETKESREYALKALRTWAESNQRIEKLRLDANFLLRFLRAKKFSVPITQECIERFLLLRKSYENLLFHHLDFTDQPTLDLINLGYIFALPERDQLGRRVIFYRPGVFDPSRYINTDMVKLHGVAYETLMEDEESQIRGFVHIVDAAGLGMRHITLFTPKEAVRIVKNGEKILPMRHKEIVAINIPPPLKFAVDFGMGLLSEKMKKRVRFLTSNQGIVGVEKRILPAEYGGEKPMKEMIELWKQELAKKREILLQHDTMSVKLDMYSAKEREGAVGALKTPIGTCSREEDNYIYGLQGSFRKLEVD